MLNSKRLSHLRYFGVLAVLIISAIVLAGCASLPGAPGGAAGQQGPSGLKPPPGLKSGGASTVIGSAVVAPDNAILLVRYMLSASAPKGGTAATFAGAWHSCRRIVLSENIVLLEGLDFDKSAAEEMQDVNVLLPTNALAELTWRYKNLPTPPAAEQPGQQPAEKPQPAPGR